MKEPARLVRRRFAEVVAYFEHPYANAVLEGADSVVRNVKMFCFNVCSTGSAVFFRSVG